MNGEAFTPDEILAHVLLAIVVIIIVARLFGRLAQRVGQPAVIGEIVAGILMGPSLLGWLMPGESEKWLFPDQIMPYLTILAKLGLILFMFIVGLELDLALIRGKGRRAGTISISSIILPFALGAVLTIFVLHDRHDCVKPAGACAPDERVDLLHLALFMGVAMSITAFPVLARILAERKMNRTTVGVLALASAAVDDIVAWSLLAVVVALVNAQGLGSVFLNIGLAVLFVAVMFLVIRPLLARLPDWYARAGRVTPNMIAIVLVGILLSSYVTHEIGIHEIFGAFLFGAVMPRKAAREFNHEVLERLEPLSVGLLLPIFFVIAGFKVDLREFRNPDLLWQLGLILLVAIGGKFGGAFLGARLERMTLQQSSAIGLLMNTRGLTEVVILLVGQQLGVLDDKLFTMMVVMALVTTIMTDPLLRVVYPDRAIQRDIEAAERAALGAALTRRVLVVVDGAPNALTARMIRLADAVLGGPGELVLTRFIESGDKAPKLELGAGVLPDLAGMAEAVESLERFAAETTFTETPIRTMCRFGSSSGDELLQQLRTTGAEALVVSEDWVRTHPEAFDALDGVTLLVVPAEVPGAWLSTIGHAALAVGDGLVYVRDDGQPDGARAVLLGVVAAKAGAYALNVIVPEGDSGIRRRVNQAVDPLRERDRDRTVTVVGSADVDAEVPVLAAARVLDRVGGSGLNLRDAVAGVV